MLEKIGRRVQMLDDETRVTPFRARPHHGEFEMFYRESWESVYRVLAVLLRDANLAAEATDEAMTRAFERWTSVSQHSNPIGWVYVVGRNWAFTELRKRRREPAHQPEVAIAAVERDVTLDQAVAALPIRLREVIVLHYLVDLTHSDIARMLRIPEGTVKSRLSRGLNALRKDVGDAP
jgi:RNA polymerase sigma factor (sigma-70 family)